MIDGKELKAQLDECADAKPKTLEDFARESIDLVRETYAQTRIVPIAPPCTETMSISKAEYFLLLEENAEMKRRLARLELERNEKQKELK